MTEARLVPPQGVMQGLADIQLVIEQLRDNGYADWPDILTRAVRAIADATVPAAAPAEGLPVDAVVAELMGVEAHLDEARERLIKANLTLAALARHESAGLDIRSGAGESRETGGGPREVFGYGRTDIEPATKPSVGDDERPNARGPKLPFGEAPAEIRGTAPAPECLPQAHRYDVSPTDPDLLICRRCGKERPA